MMGANHFCNADFFFYFYFFYFEACSESVDVAECSKVIPLPAACVYVGVKLFNEQYGDCQRNHVTARPPELP